MIQPVHERRNTQLILPPDPFWLLRVEVANDRDCVLLQLWVLWHYQWLVPREFNA